MDSDRGRAEQDPAEPKVLTAGRTDSNCRRPLGRPRRHLLNLTLAGLPELGFFEDQHQRQEVLRETLLGRSVPICLKCGYLLRGLPLASERCPECGRPFDDRVRHILAARSEDPGLK